MELTTVQAAELSGKSRTTIWRYCKNGKLSSRPNDDGDFMIDPSELERVFGKLLNPVSLEPSESIRNEGHQSKEIEHLKMQLQLTEEIANRLKDDLKEAKAEKERFLNLLENQAEQMQMLTGELQNDNRKRQGLSLFNLFRRK